MGKRKYKILYVDDELQNLIVFQETFRKEYQVFTATSGEEGLNILRREKDIPLIITDQRMPHMTGIQLLEKTIPEFPDIIRMILTGFTDIEALIEAINTGQVYRYITKPWDERELRVTIKRGLETYEISQQNKRLLKELEIKNQELEKKVAELKAALKKIELLESIEGLMGKFVPESVKQILRSYSDSAALKKIALEKQEKDVSILFLDIEGYTKMSQRLDQIQVNHLVERYFSSFVDDIYENGGDIVETAGDGLMILFQDDNTIKHTIAAVRTALAITSKVHKINEELKNDYEPILINIGINSGVAFVGSTKFQGIAGTRWAYTAVGPTTILAARLGACARGGTILISRETAERVKTLFKLEEMGPQSLKNISEAVPVYKVVETLIP
ncbi:MAG TPA: adenylate/guanylate cyclase domain-containing protein [Candidatus Limnocylindrales bacterium]|nr:adenylate/guanylate cyclase domain-containing protein [Candidatus Limnocylindrales bacterium]